jgi:alkaline phosphatase D
LGGCAHGGVLLDPGVAKLPISAQRPRIAFGSCLHQEKNQAIWRSILAAEPDVFIMLGDAGYPKKASYPTHGDVDAIAQSYERLAANPDFAAFSAKVPMLAIWDDNDFGGSDAGGDYPFKRESRSLFLDFWSKRAHVARPIVEDGVYCAYEWGPSGRRVQIILPDRRYNRSPWLSVSAAEREVRAAQNIGPYAEGPPESTLLGAAQWTWL